MEMQSDTSVTRGVENAPGAFLLCRKCGPNAVPNVEHVHNVIALIQAVNDSVDVWLLPKKEVAKLLIFRDDQAAAGKSLQTIDCFGETIEPSERVLGSIRFDVIEDRLHIPQGASGEPNEIWRRSSITSKRMLPSTRSLGSIRFDVIEDRLHIPQGASGEPNEVFHGCGGTS